MGALVIPAPADWYFDGHRPICRAFGRAMFGYRRKARMPAREVWCALSASAELGDLYRCEVLDRITAGRPVRAPWGGWGYDRDGTGAIQFPDAMRAHVALSAAPLWWRP